MADGARTQSPTQSLEAAVDDLYEFRDHFAERHGLARAGDKEKEVEKKMQEVLQTVETAQGSVKNKALYQLLRGKALNVTAQYSVGAEESLSKAVKLDPKSVDAWNQLGECYWKKDDVAAAKNCFTGALGHRKNKVSLRNLSMVLRQLSGPPVEKVKLIEESVDRAKEAVQMDITDGTSWLILGNAYLCQFFATGQHPKVMKQCMQAYGQAEKDAVARGNPDLHFNRATTFMYREEYQSALEGFHTAAQLDPSWEEARSKESQLLTYLSDIQDMTHTKGKLKPKKLESMLKGLSERDLGPIASGQYVNPSTGQPITLNSIPLSDLQAKVNEGKVILGKVVCSINSVETVPFTFCMVDASQACVMVTVYNIAQGAGVKIGDSIAIPEPCVRKVKISHCGKEYSFTSVSVETPRSLVVNGRRLGANKEALPVLSISTVSE